MHEAVVLYAELAAVAMASFISSKDTPLMEPVRLNDGFEESRDALKKFRGEEDDDFQFLEYQAHKGYPEAMYRLGVFYYFGLRVSNTLAFYLAMASVMFAVVPSLPMPQEGVLEELGRARHIMSSSLFLLLTSIGCTLVSFAAASAVVVDGEHYYGASDLLLKPSIIGWFVCLIAMASFCIRVMRLVFYRNSVVRLIYKFNFGAFCEKIGSPSWTIIFCLTVLWWIAVVFFTILVFLPLAMCSRRAIRPRLETITECWPDEYKMIKARRTSNLFRMLTCREELDSD